MQEKAYTERIKEANTVPQPTMLANPLEIFLPNNAMTKNPNKGKIGISATIEFIYSAPPKSSPSGRTFRVF